MVNTSPGPLKVKGSQACPHRAFCLGQLPDSEGIALTVICACRTEKSLIRSPLMPCQVRESMHCAIAANTRAIRDVIFLGGEHTHTQTEAPGQGRAAESPSHSTTSFRQRTVSGGGGAREIERARIDAGFSHRWSCSDVSLVRGVPKTPRLCCTHTGMPMSWTAREPASGLGSSRGTI